MKKYRFGFEFWGITLFFLVMLPNCVWFAVPAPNDVLRGASVTPGWDAAASVFQILLIASLCFLKNRNSKNFCFYGKLTAAVGGCVACYYLSWGFYYAGVTNALVILSMCLFPCGAFALFGTGRRNGIAVALAVSFMVCHLVHVVINFVI